mmetsp:Transcript_20637/g.42821  ORF Transcript_20637/g.42821 Transcript_20637/m.42821 type:complete len:150 (-) Transcript_20637:484-933(-)
MPALSGGNARAGLEEQGDEQHDLERNDPVGNCQKDVDAALGAVRENLVKLADRDARLHDLQDKSTAFQNTSEKFTGQAKTLQWRTKWQKYRLYGLVAVLVMWALLSFAFRQHLLIYFSVSSVAFVVLFVMQHFLAKRWISQVDKTQLLT